MLLSQSGPKEYRIRTKEEPHVLVPDSLQKSVCVGFFIQEKVPTSSIFVFSFVCRLG